MKVDTIYTPERPIIELSNGKLVANFSSPHPFTFTDGNILPAKSKIEAERLKVNFHEQTDQNGDVKLTFSLSNEVGYEMIYWLRLYEQNKINVVFCPLPMITALKNKNTIIDDLKKTPFRAVRMDDRILKLVSIDKQCL
jgi:hypothetical protein